MQDSNIKTVSVPLIRGSAMHISDLEVIGSYSVNSEREYVDDLSELRYYKEPANKNVRFDLNYNANTTISTVDEPWDTNFLLKWISNNFDSLRAQDVNKNKTQRLAAHFICYRGVLKNLLHTPFNTSSGWIICAAKLKESIYLYHYDTDEVIKQNLNMTEHAKRLTAYGFKFQQFALSGINDLLIIHYSQQILCIYRKIMLL
ncbi:decapping and exoribonuclease protein-like [Ceratina calcarata]|uniref:Decapping nuclease n=1 Tax=Ceratina calcarata TaxID=156304 RepID=A0AAJ7SAD1_9HYME|nr:decapping and exoribonuclease protein-like [Ceratina calcarata]